MLKSNDGDSDFIHASRVPLGDNPNEVDQYLLILLSDLWMHCMSNIFQRSVSDYHNAITVVEYGETFLGNGLAGKCSSNIIISNFRRMEATR